MYLRISWFILDVIALQILILVATTEVHHEYFVLLLLKPNQKVLRFNVVVNESL